MKLIKNRNQNKKKRGAALVEYGLLVAGVALTTAVAVSILGHKTNDLLGTAAALIPGSDADSAGAIQGGQLMKTKNEGGVISLDSDPTRTLEDVYGVTPGTAIVDSDGTGGGQ